MPSDTELLDAVLEIMQDDAYFDIVGGKSSRFAFRSLDSELNVTLRGEGSTPREALTQFIARHTARRLKE